MNTNTKKVIESFLAQWDQRNEPKRNTPIQNGEYLYVFGGCCGVAIYPESRDRLLFVILGEDDGHYFIKERLTWDNFWLDDLINVLEIAKNYLSKHATEKYFSGTTTLCGYKLPWKKSKLNFINNMAKYRKKPVVIEAIQWKGDNLGEIKEFMGITHENYKPLQPENSLFIKTLEGKMEASVGDFIIKGVKGEFYPCKPDIFEKTYESISNEEI